MWSYPVHIIAGGVPLVLYEWFSDVVDEPAIEAFLCFLLLPHFGAPTKECTKTFGLQDGLSIPGVLRRRR